jgi:uncharacterized cupredoxin-like copper-binding protein
MRKKIIITALCISLAFGMAACGAGGPSTTINVTLTDFQFSPSVFTVPAGREITVNAVNTGAIQHDFVIMKFGTTVGENYGEEDEPNIYWRIDLQPGEESSGTFTAPSEPGEYQVVCAVQGHFLAGMIAKMTVVAE